MPIHRHFRLLALSLSLTLFLAAGLTLTGCNSGTGGAGAEDPRNIQDSIHAFLTPDLIDSLKKYGMTINEGSNPPNVEGFYFANSQKRKGSNVPNDNTTTFHSMSIKLSGQTADQRINLDYDQVVEKGSGSGAFITGSGNLFTLYVPIKARYIARGDTVDYETAVCYSGRVDSEGIHEFINGLVVTKKDPDTLGIVLKVGEGRVIEEGDTLAAKVTDYPHVVVVTPGLKAKIAATLGAGGTSGAGN